ncbi:uncharacterized protein TNCV_789021 [Trichonephila clavipes]|nr:uncharacterized protein TNCV_789021 [Trichonephila clavipes]
MEKFVCGGERSLESKVGAKLAANARAMFDENALLWASSPTPVLRGIGILKRKFDEAHFWLNGYVDKQNCRIWSDANPQVYVETTLHPEKLTVWCALWAGGILLQKRWPQRYSQW